MSLVWFILLIGGLITVHELGHFVVARLLDVKVLKVSIGFGPALASFKRGDTEYALSAVPLGGYVKLLGEDRADPIGPGDRGRAFWQKPAWQRLAVVLGGPAANLLCPLFIFAHIYAGQVTAISSTIGTVFEGQPAAGADLRPGDRVVAIDGEPVRYWEDFNAQVTSSPGRELRITVERGGVERGGQERALTKYVTPREHLRTDAFGGRERVGLIGVAPHFRLPQVGVETESAAWRAGMRSFDVVTSVQGRPVATLSDLEPLLHPRTGGMQVVTFVRPQAAALGFAAVARLEPHTAQIVPAAVERIGRSPRFDSGMRAAELFVADVQPGTPAAHLGLHRGDALTHLDGVALTAWELFAQTLEERPDEEHTLGWRSAEAPAVERFASFRMERRREMDEYRAEQTFYVFGAEGARAIVPVPEARVERRVVSAVGQAVTRAVTVTVTLVRVVGMTLVGRLPASAIGGPILIYQVAGVAAQHGVDHFLVMAALVSLNLGLLNLLPVPLLDGGQALFVVLEAVRRRPLSASMRERAAFVGVALLVALLLLASRNDLVHFFR